MCSDKGVGCVQGMSFAKGLSANFISTPLSLSSVVPGVISSGSESALSSGFGSIAVSGRDTSLLTG